MSKKLVIDMNKCDECEKCTVQCAYIYQPKPITQHGILALREMVYFLLVCRRCENPSCAAACNFSALERQPNGLMKRYNMRCVSCKCCAHGCPFGTIYVETVPFYATRCDFCLSEGREPGCQFSCVKKAIEYREVQETEKDIIELGDHLAVRSRRWSKEDKLEKDLSRTVPLDFAENKWD